MTKMKPRMKPMGLIIRCKELEYDLGVSFATVLNWCYSNKLDYFYLPDDKNFRIGGMELGPFVKVSEFVRFIVNYRNGKYLEEFYCPAHLEIIRDIINNPMSKRYEIEDTLNDILTHFTCYVYLKTGMLARIENGKSIEIICGTDYDKE